MTTEWMMVLIISCILCFLICCSLTIATFFSWRMHRKNGYAAQKVRPMQGTVLETEDDFETGNGETAHPIPGWDEHKTIQPMSFSSASGALSETKESQRTASKGSRAPNTSPSGSLRGSPRGPQPPSPVAKSPRQNSTRLHSEASVEFEKLQRMRVSPANSPMASPRSTEERQRPRMVSPRVSPRTSPRGDRDEASNEFQKLQQLRGSAQVSPRTFQPVPISSSTDPDVLAQEGDRQWQDLQRLRANSPRDPNNTSVA